MFDLFCLGLLTAVGLPPQPHGVPPVGAPARAEAAVVGAAWADAGDDALAVGVGLLERRLPELALVELEGYLERFPGHPAVGLGRLYLGEAHFQLGAYAEALEAFEAALPRLPSARLAEARLRAAQCAFELADYGGAAARAEELLGRSPGALAAPARALWGDAELRLGRAERAELAYGALLEDGAPIGAGDGDPTLAAARLDALYGGSFAARDLGRAAQALERVERFLKAAPQDGRGADLCLLAGAVELGRGRREAALDCYRAAVTRLALVAEGERARIERQARLGQARAMLELGQGAPAVQVLEGFEALLSAMLAPEQARLDGELALLRGRALLLIQDFEGVLAALGERAGPELWRLRGEALLGLQRPGDAALAFGRCADAQGDYAAAHAALSAGDLAGASKAAEAGLARGTSAISAALALLLGEAKLRAGEGTAAVSALQRALQPMAASGASNGSAAAEASGVLEPGEALRARYLLAWGAWQAGDSALAENAALAALEDKRPAAEQAELHFIAARAAESLAQPEAALQRHLLAAEAAGALNPRPALYAEALWRAAELSNGAEREALLAQLIAQDGQGPFAAPALLRRAEAAAERGEGSAAEADYSRLLERFPTAAEAPPARYGRAFAAFEAGRWSAAREDLAILLRDAALLPASLCAAALELDVYAWTRQWTELSQPTSAGSSEVQGERSAAAGQTTNANAGLASAPSAQFDAALAELDARVEALLAPRLLALPGVAVSAGSGLLSAARGMERIGQPLAAQALLRRLVAVLQGDIGPAEERGARLELARSAAIDGLFLTLASPAGAAQAELEARQLLAEGPLDAALAEALFFIAEAHFESGNDALAEELYLLCEPQAGELAEAAAYKRGFAALRRGDSTAARLAFEQQLRVAPAGKLAGEGAYLLGEACWQAGADAAAIAALEGLLAAQPRHATRPKALLRLGLARARAGLDLPALEALDAFVGEQPNAPERASAELARARCHRRLKAPLPAKQALLRVLELDQTGLAAAAQLELAELAREQGQYSAALTEYLKLPVLYEPSEPVAQALFGAAEMLEQLGRPERAREQYAEFLGAYPEHALAERAGQRLAALEEH